MQKLLENKWGKLLLFVALSLVFMIINIIFVSNGDGRVDYSAASIAVYIAIPVMYLAVVVFNYLRFSLLKFARWIVFIASLVVAAIGALILLIGPFAFNPGAGYSLMESGISMWQCFVYGAGLGSMITYTILYYDFQKLGYRPENAEKRNWKSNLIFYSVVYLGALLFGGILMLIVKAVAQDWLLVVVVIAVAVFTVGAIIKTIREYGLPLGNSKEWDEWLEKHNYTYTNDYELPEEPSKGDIETLCRSMYYTAEGCTCEVDAVRVERVGDREYSIKLGFRWNNASHMTDESYKDPKVREYTRDQVVSQIQSALNGAAIGYTLEEI